jgi:hypothetical protein
MREDSLLEAPELLAGFEPQLVRQPAAGRAIGVEGFGMTPCAVERQHQLRHEALAERMLADESFELGEGFGVLPECDLRVNTEFDRGESELLQPS